MKIIGMTKLLVKKFLLTVPAVAVLSIAFTCGVNMDRVGLFVR